MDCFLRQNFRSTHPCGGLPVVERYQGNATHLLALIIANFGGLPGQQNQGFYMWQVWSDLAKRGPNLAGFVRHTVGFLQNGGGVLHTSIEGVCL